MVQVELAPRLRDAQLWWVASTLVRRHPGLALVENVRPPGAGDCLTAIRGDHWVASLDRAGLLYAGELAGCHTELAYESSDPYEIVAFIESAAGLGPPEDVPEEPPRSLTYRIAAALMQLTVNYRQRLDVRAIGTPEALVPFPAALLRAQERHPADPMEDPLLRFWKVLRDDEVVAILDNDGYVYLAGKEFSLPAVYEHHQRRIVAVLNTCFGHLLD